MAHSLLFIPDISGYTKFIQSTEIEHAEHVIAEILEVLIAANTQKLKLAEIEGDALFFYKEEVPSKEAILAQVENMFTAFHSHLKMLEKNRICSCNACATAPELRLKIIAHCGEIQFLKVQGSHKPFGNSVIEAHRLLKNSIQSNNYFALSMDLANGISLTESYKSQLYQFKLESEEYDGKQIPYLFATINEKELKLNSFATPQKVNFQNTPNIIHELEIESSAEYLLEAITNYRYRSAWVKEADAFEFDENEVTRLGSEHTCIVGGKELNFITVTKNAEPQQLVYGEMTKSPPPVDELYNFFIIDPIHENKCKLSVEQYWKAKSPIKKLFLLLLFKGLIKQNMGDSIKNLKKLVEEKAFK